MDTMTPVYGSGTLLLRIAGGGWSRSLPGPPSLLESQLDTLEPLQADEQGMDVDPALPVDRLAAIVLARLDLA